MQDIDVTVTITEYLKGIKISLSDEPVDLHNLDDGGSINWILDDDSASSGWRFHDTAGVVIKRNSRRKFRRTGPSNSKKHFTWIRRSPDDPGSDHYNYTITVENGDRTASWDPSIINQP